MAIAIVHEWSDANADAYDAITGKMGVRESPPAGLIFHAAGMVGGGWRIFDVWESEEAFEKFSRERLGPSVQEVTQGRLAPPTETRYQLHNTIRP